MIFYLFIVSRPVMVFLGCLSVALHFVLFFLDAAYYNVMLFIRSKSSGH